VQTLPKLVQVNNKSKIDVLLKIIERNIKDKLNYILIHFIYLEKNKLKRCPNEI